MQEGTAGKECREGGSEFNISNGFMQLRVAHLHRHFTHSARIESALGRAFEVARCI